MWNRPKDLVPPSITQQRAFAYAAKPFALLSFLSSLWIIYRLLIRCAKRKLTMYHRLILSAAFCLSILSFCLFWGTWAMPVGTTYVVGASGNNNTCEAQGFLYDWAYIAFPFYYASFSVLALVSVKHNFKEEKYVWMEKWIHLLAYVPPLIFVIYASISDWLVPGVAICSFRYFLSDEPSMGHIMWHKILAAVQFLELLVATITITYLWVNFSKIQASIDAAIGMKKIREEARKQRTRDVAIQSGVYLFSFWFMYIANIVAMTIFNVSRVVPYNALIVSHLVTGTQGMILLGVYYGVRQRDYKKSPVTQSAISDGNETVSMIRAKAASPAQRPRLSVLHPASFRIFDGTPAEDSPWAAFLEDDIESFGDDEINTQGTSGRTLATTTENDLSTSLLN